MTRTLAVAGLAALAFSANAQVFDAASVRIHAASVEQPRNGPWLQTGPDSVTMRNAKLLWCLAWAYDQKEWLISGPDWITSERYDIVAKAAGPVALAQLKLMTQALLTDRFKLALRRETRELPVAVLIAAKNGPKNLAPAAGSGPPDGPRPVGAGKGVHPLAYKNVSLPDFAERLGAPPPLGLGERVVDGTGVTGVFDITLKMESENLAGTAEFADLLKAVIEQQFGLKLERRKMPLDALVIDSGNKIPVEN
jgi:uncharacterized protein (TIGR03435 family)